MSRTDWEKERAELEQRLEPFTRESATGERYVIPHPAVARFARAYDRLFQYGLTRGWLGGEAVPA
ncbi:hypothetical protein [Parvimonas micra]|uniref:hypothetical protein n=1 Tax=Parvimonas micra TaxID=33033 RepID=UPI002B469957|nr:hypothetical protein [Parvimonas micra]